MSETWKKSHNIGIPIYQYVCPAKFRRIMFNTQVDDVLREVCLEIEKRYKIKFIEIGTEKDRVHFLIQSEPMQSAKKIIQTVKTLIERERC